MINNLAIKRVNELTSQGFLNFATGWAFLNLAEEGSLKKKDLAKKLACSVKTAGRYLESLCLYGFIKKEGNYYSIISDWTNLSENPHNNIYNNNNNIDKNKTNKQKTEELRNSIPQKDLEYAANLFGKSEFAEEIREILVQELKDKEYVWKVLKVTAEYCAYQYHRPGERHKQGLNVVWNPMGYFRVMLQKVLKYGIQKCMPYKTYKAAVGDSMEVHNVGSVEDKIDSFQGYENDKDVYIDELFERYKKREISPEEIEKMYGNKVKNKILKKDFAESLPTADEFLSDPFSDRFSACLSG